MLVGVAWLALGVFQIVKGVAQARSPSRNLAEGRRGVTLREWTLMSSCRFCGECLRRLEQADRPEPRARRFRPDRAHRVK